MGRGINKTCMWGKEVCGPGAVVPPICDVTVRPPCQIESGISGFGDLGRDYKDGFRRGVVPKREIGHVRRHVTRRITSED